MRFTEQSSLSGRSRFSRAVNPAPIQSGSIASMNIPFELISRVLARRTAEPHSISRSARNEYRGAQRRSRRRDDCSPLPIVLVQPPARDYVPRRQGEIAVPLFQAYLFFRHISYDAERGCFVPSNPNFDGALLKRRLRSMNLA